MIKRFLQAIKQGAERRWAEKLALRNYPLLSRLPLSARSDQEHLEATLAWLSLAQDVTKSGGVSAAYDLARQRWSPAYRETTGYIIETFLNYYHTTKQEKFLTRAIHMGHWELQVQCPDGAFGEIRKDQTVGKKIFNTGQVLIGLLALFEETHDRQYLESALKAADWLLAQQESDGSWINFTTQGKKTYHTRVAWPLAHLAQLVKNPRYATAAEKQIRWSLSQQQENFWFDQTSLSPDNSPWTHLIAYTLSGLLEYYQQLTEKDEKMFRSFYKPAEKLLDIFAANKYQFLPASFDRNWQSQDRHTCLTGDAQIAIVWFQIYDLTQEERFRHGAEKIVEMIKTTQFTQTDQDILNGGIFGSYPLAGDYGPFHLLNWGAKFFADALLLKQQIHEKS